MSAGNNGGPEWPSIRENDAVREESVVPSISGGDSAGRSVVVTVDSGEEKARVSLVDADKLTETKASDTRDEFAVLKAENEESRLDGASEGALENQPSFSVSGEHLNGKKNTDIRNGISEIKKVDKSVADYDSVLSEFDQFVSEGAGEAVGSVYEIGDMVWGKVKSHPWWPGHVYNEAFASHSVNRSKREGHVLVAFFGDSSYGWFHPSELVPFEENFAEKSQQTSSRAFVKAVEEAVDEISRRQGVGLACCCRNEFNFRPSNMADHFVVDVGDYEPGVYSLSQINKAREDFRTNELLLFVQQLALKPMSDQHLNIEFIKNRSTLLGCRKAFFEEFDDTYAQAFGTVPERPLRPTAPMAVDPSKALLSGRQVFAETPSKGKISVKSTKSKEQVEKDNYLFIRRDAPVHTKTKKTSSVQVGLSGHPLLVDGLGLTQIPVDSSIKSQTSVSAIYDGQHEPPSDKASVVGGIQLYEGSKKLVDESGQKKANVRKRQAGELSAENATLDIKKVKKRKKEIKNESSANIFKLPLTNSHSGAAMEKVSGMLLDVPLGNRKKDDSKAHQEVVDLLLILVRDLRALALDPFYGVERNFPASTQLAFLKYRSLVYQKSLVSLPSTGNEAIEAHTSTLPASNALRTPNDKSTMRLMKHSTRHIHDPTIGGKKRGPSDRPETIKKNKLLVDPQGINKRIKIAGSEEVKKRKILVNSKLMDGGKKIQQRPTESQREAAAARNVPPKAVKPESSSKRMNEQPTRVSNPTMLVMKFPPSATLPSGNELKAKFARFGSLDLNATRIFWKTSTCRLVYRRKVDAEEALDFAVGSNSLFGSTKVICYVREVGVEASVESEPVKASQSRESTFEHYNIPSANTGSQQLKSCLKKPTNDEGGNGNGRGTRVKFILGGGEGSGSKTNEQLSSLPVSVDPSLHNNEHSMESTGIKNLPKLTPHTPVVTPLMPTTNTFTISTTTITNNTSVIATHHQLQKSPTNMITPELLPLNLPQPTPQKPSTKDISHQLLNLLTRCSDVVNNVTGVLGYRPYHAL